MQVPLELAAVPALVGFASATGRRVGIHPKAQDDWLVVPNLWGGIIARPGRLKSPTLAETLKPVRRLAAASGKRHQERSAEVTTKLISINAREKALKNQLRKAFEGKDDAGNPAELEQQLQELQKEQRELKADLTERRFVVNDTTVEKLGELLAIHPQGLLLERDELAGWLRSLEREDRKGDREFFLEAWNGLNSYTYDRIGRGTIHIPALCLSIIGGIQPTKLSRHVAEALDGGYAADGLLQRFQLLVWPEEDGLWELVDRAPDLEALETVCKIFTAIDEADFEHPEEECDGIPVFRFDEEAQQLFYDWLSQLEGRLRSAELRRTPAFESHLAKYRSLMPSLALLFHLVDVVRGESQGPVSVESAKLAADWCEYLELHARKIYADELDIGLSSAHALADKIRTGRVHDRMTVREVYTKGWTQLTSSEKTWQAVAVLKEHGWVRVEVVETGGRPSHLIRVHPKLMEDS